MTKAEAGEVLIRYNTWRRYNGPLEQTPLQPEPKEIGEAIDVAGVVVSGDEILVYPVFRDPMQDDRMNDYLEDSFHKRLVPGRNAWIDVPEDEK